jgi:hypothetical protein
MNRLLPLILSAILPLSAIGQQIRPQTQPTLPGVRVPSAPASGTRAELFAASAPSGDEVRLRVRVTQGWLPPEGVRIYRTVNDKKTLVYESRPMSDDRADAALNPSIRNKQMWSSAARTMTVERPLEFRPVRPPSAGPKFLEIKAASDELRRLQKPADARAAQARTQALSRLHQAHSVAPMPPALRTPAVAANNQERQTLDARAKLSLSSLLDPEAAAKLGLGASDDGVKRGDRATYQLVAVKGGRDDAVLASTSITVGEDRQPPAPANVVWHQHVDDNGEPGETVSMRWDRIDPALESQLLNAAYIIERRPADAGALTPLTPGVRPLPGGRAAPRPTALLWERIHQKPIVIIAINGDEEPISFCSDVLPEPGSFRYRIALLDGFGRQSPWSELDISASDWRRPESPGAVEATLITAVAAAPAVPQGRPIPGAASPIQNIGLRHSGIEPRQLSGWSSAILAGRLSPSVMVSWRAVSAPEGLTAQYSIWRIDADNPQAPPTLLTPNPVEGELLPLNQEQALAKAEVVRLATEVAVARRLLTAAPAAQREQAEATYNERRAALRQARLLAAPRRGWSDTSAKLDSKYRYIVRAIFQPSGLDSEDNVSAVVSVPSPAPPPRPENARFTGFTASSQLPPAQLANDAARTPGKIAHGRPRVAPAPAAFKVAPQETPGKFSLARTVQRPGMAGAPSAPAARLQPARAPGRAQPGVPQLGLAPRVPILGAQVISKLALNLGRSRDDGGVVTLQWNAVPLREASYRIRRRAGQEPFVDVGVTSATTWRDVVPRSRARTYQYEVVAVTRWGIAGSPTPAIAAPVACTLRASQPNVLGAAPDAEVDRAIRVRIAPNLPDESVSTYRIFRDGALAGEVHAPQQPQSELFFLDQGRDPKRPQPHRYTVIAVNPAGASEESRAVTAGALQLTVGAPAQARATKDARGVTLAWTAVPGSTYCVQRRTGNSPQVALAGNLQSGTYLDAAAFTGVAYVYEITAVDAAGNVSDPAIVNITP